MSVQRARQVAYDVLRAVDEDDAYANLLLPHEIARAGLDTKDAALATELTYGTLRRRGTYDAIIAVAADRDVDRIDAAVHEAVELVRRNGSASAAGFANAVLRRISRDTPGEWIDRAVGRARSDDERLGVSTSHPVWVLRAFRRALAAEGRADELDALLEADNDAPGVTMIALPGLAEPPRGAASGHYSPFAFARGGGDPDELIRASEGRVRVQDEGSQLAALALTRARPVRPGERWLDLCAGPGGKTALMAAEALAGGAILDANEIAPARAELVRRAVAPVPLEVPVSEEDGRTRAARSAGEYDRVLVDAPCTGIGALRRRPEARWRKAPADVPALTELQRELVLAGFEALAPGGILAYVTCSPHLAETAGVLADVHRELGDRVEELDARAVLTSVAGPGIDLPEQADGSGRAQLWPHRHGTDAMSIALLRRVDVGS